MNIQDEIEQSGAARYAAPATLPEELRDRSRICDMEVGDIRQCEARAMVVNQQAQCFLRADAWVWEPGFTKSPYLIIELATDGYHVVAYNQARYLLQHIHLGLPNYLPVANVTIGDQP